MEGELRASEHTTEASIPTNTPPHRPFPESRLLCQAACDQPPVIRKATPKSLKACARGPQRLQTFPWMGHPGHPGLLSGRRVDIWVNGNVRSHDSCSTSLFFSGAKFCKSSRVTHEPCTDSANNSPHAMAMKLLANDAKSDFQAKGPPSIQSRSPNIPRRFGDPRRVEPLFSAPSCLGLSWITMFTLRSKTLVRQYRDARLWLQVECYDPLGS